MSLLFSLTSLFGLMVLFTSIGDDALSLGVAGVLVLVGATGKAWIEQRTQKQVKAQNDELHSLIEDGHSAIDEQLAQLSRDVATLAHRINDLESVVTTPDRDQA